MNMKQAKEAIINEMSAQTGFKIAPSTKIENHWVMGVKLGNYSVCEAVKKMESDYVVYDR